jgi:hypothetical protein
MGRWFTQLPFSCRFIYISSHMSRSIRAWAAEIRPMTVNVRASLLLTRCRNLVGARAILSPCWIFNFWNILLRACLWLETENMDGCLIHFLPYRFSPNFHTASRVSMSTRSSYHLRNATATFECSATCMRTFSLSITLKSINPHQPMSSYFSAYHL